jgi:hypothetical protein
MKPTFKTMQDEIDYAYANNKLVAEDLEQHIAGIKRKWSKENTRLSN